MALPKSALEKPQRASLCTPQNSENLDLLSHELSLLKFCQDTRNHLNSGESHSKEYIGRCETKIRQAAKALVRSYYEHPIKEQYGHHMEEDH